MPMTGRILALASLAWMALWASAAGGSKPVTGGWQETVVSVSDLAAWQGVLSQVAGWQVLHQGQVPRAWLEAWGLPDHASASEILMANPGSSGGWVRLVQFSGMDQVLIRSNAQTWETGGWFDLNARVKDMEAKSRALQSLGWQGRSDPVQFEFGPFTVKEWLAMGPDGVALALIQRVAPPLEGWPHLRDLSRAFNATQIVADMDKSLDFYLNTLGFETYLEHRGASEFEGPNVLGLPHNLSTRISRQVYILHPQGENLGSVELLSFEGATGRDFAHLARPPNLGILMLRFPAPEPAAVQARIDQAGLPVVFDRRSLELAPYGKVTAVGARGPNGEWLEFLSNMASPAGGE